MIIFVRYLMSLTGAIKQESCRHHCQQDSLSKTEPKIYLVISIYAISIVTWISLITFFKKTKSYYMNNAAKWTVLYLLLSSCLLLCSFLCGFIAEPAIHCHNLRAKSMSKNNMSWLSDVYIEYARNRWCGKWGKNVETFPKKLGNVSIIFISKIARNYC